MRSMYEETMRKLAAKQSIDFGVYNEGDYYEEIDGYNILHCKECHQPKQQINFISKRPYKDTLRMEEEYALRHQNLTADEVHKAVMNKMPPKYLRTDLGLVGVPCKCQQDYIEGRKRREKSDERLAIIKENKAKCYMSFVLTKEKYSDYTGNEFIEATKEYSKKWAEMRKDGKGLVLCGKAGSGKTIAAICMTNELLEKEVNVIFKAQQEIIYEAQGDVNNRKQYLDELVYCGLLVIDDLNLQVVNTDGAREILFYIIDTRIKLKKPIIITTNHSALAFQNSANDANKRIFERLNNSCDVIENNEHNYRAKRGGTYDNT